MHLNRFSPASFLTPFLALLLFSCEHEKKEAQLNALTTEVRFLQKDVTETRNAAAAATRKEEALKAKFNETNSASGKNQSLKEQLEATNKELATKKAAYGQLLLDMQAYKENHSLEEFTSDQSE